MQRLQAWWLELPLSYRVNALLYLLGGAALIVLLSTLFSGSDKPRQIEVGAGAVTTTTRKPQPSTTPLTAPASSTSIFTTTTIPAGAAVPGGTGATPSGATVTTAPFQSSSGGGGSGASGAGGGGGGGGGGVVVPAPTPAPPEEPACYNSGEARCGAFRWDPPVTQSSGIGMTIIGSGTARAGDRLNFVVTARDPDHVIPAGCWVVSYGDGGGEERGDCPTPPQCPPHFGPWAPPPPAPGDFQRLFSHAYSRPGTFTVRVTLSSLSADTCLDLDPWASVGESETFAVTITPRLAS